MTAADWRVGFTITDADIAAVADAPPLTNQQRNKLAVLLQPVRQRRTEAAREALRASKRGGQTGGAA